MTVHLVGAGPGDPELLTLKAARLLAAAEAVVHDRLIPAATLDLMAPSAERYDVGKTPGRTGSTQEQINDLLVCLGRRLTTVVRLKGGDPFVFGRGIEERRACHRAGIEVEVVPGISSSLAAPATAGISVTERGVSSGTCIVTAHQDPDSAEIDWSALAASGLTITVLMGARRARRVAVALLDGGRSPDEPVAVISNATRPDESRWYGTLETLGVEPVPAPSVLVIGPAARSGTGRAVEPGLAPAGPPVVAGSGHGQDIGPRPARKG